MFEELIRDMFMKCSNCGRCHWTLEMNNEKIACQNEKSTRRDYINAGYQPLYERADKFQHTRVDGKVLRAKYR